MKLKSLKVRNYRTLEAIDLDLPAPYAAICGANDSGKTNVVRAIRTIVRGDRFSDFSYIEDDGFSVKDDFPKWEDIEPSKREISFEIAIELDRKRDIGLHQSVSKQLSIEEPADPLHLSISLGYHAERVEPNVVVTINNKKYSGLDAQEVLKKIQSSKCIIFHNSTAQDFRSIYPRGSIAGHIREITGEHEPLVTSMKKTVDRGLAKISKTQQAQFKDLLGRLQTKYRVGLSMPKFDFGYLPFSITLGDNKVEVPLDDWGSGTRNRTLVLLALFRARQIGDSEPSASKITPVIIVEEPESFLHPSAQAEFGRVLQDLAEEFRVQVLVTTHSPYLLNLKDPGSNILLRRHIEYRQPRATERVDTSGDNWMAPFGQALGIDTEEFKPWKRMLFADSDTIVLVEGDTDKDYFEMLRDPCHGTNRLQFTGDIVPYDGTGSLSNHVLLRFLKNRYRRIFVTFDLEAMERIEKVLKGLQLERGKDYLPVGVNAAGKKSIEGLLPEKITSKVYGSNPELVQVATNGDKEERQSAKNKLKRLLFEEFKRQACPGAEYYGGFYPICKAMTKALR